MNKLTKEEFEVIFDVLNVYDPNDIKHVFPEMGEEKFLRDVTNAWKKVLNIISEEGYGDEDFNACLIPIRDEGSRSTHTWDERSFGVDDHVHLKLKELLRDKKKLDPTT